MKYVQTHTLTWPLSMPRQGVAYSNGLQTAVSMQGSRFRLIPRPGTEHRMASGTSQRTRKTSKCHFGLKLRRSEAKWPTKIKTKRARAELECSELRFGGFSRQPFGGRLMQLVVTAFWVANSLSDRQNLKPASHHLSLPELAAVCTVGSVAIRG